MSSERANQPTPSEADSSPPAPEVLERIRQPAPMDQAIADLSPEELKSNPAVVPQMLNNPGDLRSDLEDLAEDSGDKETNLQQEE